MSENLDDLRPASIWHYFRELSAIPRASKKEGAAAAWVAAQGRALGLEVETDAAGNVLIRKPATPGREGAAPVAMQAHCDMVCVKGEGSGHVFDTDPILLRVDDGWVRASDTTLGADDGIGVAAGLAAMAATDLAHPALELLVTVDEEKGMSGAKALRPDWLRAKRLLNLDSEEEGFVTIGCAGGIDTVASRAVAWEPAPACLAALRVRVQGGRGGHSGIVIHEGRANAIRVLAQVLGALRSRFGVGVASVDGGDMRNAIPHEATAVVVVAPGVVPAVREAVAAQAAAWSNAFGAREPTLSIAVEPAAATRVASGADARAVVDLLRVLPHGVEAMSPAIEGLAQTSTNLGVVRTTDAGFEVNLLSRSSIESSRDALADRIEAACALAGFASQRVGGYPGWQPRPGTALERALHDAWRSIAGEDLKVMAIHAGLECGIIGEKYPGMEMVSFGPDVVGAHTPLERVRIASVARFWELLVATLARL